VWALGRDFLERSRQVDNQQFADTLHRGAAGFFADRCQVLVARRAIVTEDANLDQFVNGQRTADFGQHCVAKAGIADDHHRVEVVRQALERLALGGVERQGVGFVEFHGCILDPFVGSR
jgi:hypothetical protein